MSSSDIENLQTKLSRFNIKQLRAYVKNNKLNIKDRSSEGLRKKIIKASQRKNNNLTHKYQVVAVASGFETPPQKTTNYNSPKKTIQTISDEKIYKRPGCYLKVAKNLQHVEGFHNLPKPIEKLPIYKPTKTMPGRKAPRNISPALVDDTEKAPGILNSPVNNLYSDCLIVLATSEALAN